MRKILSSFSYLNMTQSLVVLNDSIFRLIVAYSLIDLLGTGKSNQILAISAVLFVVPFLLFSMPAGQLADKFSKRSVILWSLWAELVFMFLGLFAIMMRDVFTSYFALFLIALQSAIFSPAKYAILPEIVPSDRLSKVNGFLTLTTYLTIIVGTFIASFVSEVTARNYTFVIWLCILFSLLAIFTGLKIEKTPVKNREKRLNPWFLIDIYRSLKLSSQYKHLVLALFASSYFLYTAGYTQLNLIPFGIQSLGITDVQTGYVYLAAALGIGVGSLLVGMLSGKNIELGLSVWGAFGTGASYLLLYLVQHDLFISCLLFFSIGMHGGLYVVPLDAYIQFKAPEKERGSIVAAGAFLSFAAVLFSAGTLYLLGDVLHLKAATGFLLIGFLTIIVSIWMLFSLPDYLTRFIAIVAARLFFTVHYQDKPNKGVIVCRERRKLSYLFPLILAFQKVRIIQEVEKPPSYFQKLYAHIFNTILFHHNNRDALYKAYKEGYVLLFFSDNDILIHSLQEEFIENFTFVSIQREESRSTSHFHFFKVFQNNLNFQFTSKL